MFYIIVCIIILKKRYAIVVLSKFGSFLLACPSFLKNEGKTLHSSFLVSFFLP